MKNRLLIHAWVVYKKDQYYLPYMNWIYLKEIVKYYDEVILLAPEVLIKEDHIITGMNKLSSFKNVKIKSLPEAHSYISNIKYLFNYILRYNQLSKYKFNVIYSRYPSPFGWLQRFYGNDKTYRIIHYVGEPLDTIEKNPNLSRVQKKLYSFFFSFENLMFDVASRYADKVYTNGHHIANKLKKKNINAIPVISSTLNEDDFYFQNDKIIDLNALRIIYVGYLNKAKGIEVIIEAFKIFQKIYPLSKLTIVGKGELEEKIKQIVIEDNLKNVILTGHIDDRMKLLELFRNNDVFAFGSFSEGSPRVILEAMANGLAVVSTPVGSLPSIFENNKDILFAEFNSPVDFANKFKLFANDINLLNKVRMNSYNKTTAFTIQDFLKNIFQVNRND